MIKTSRFLSFVLRHKPDAVGITLDAHGWADVKELIAAVNPTHPIDMEMLEEIVRTDDKMRYSFNEDKTKIRANQGHSIPVDVEPEERVPPTILYHGTGEKYVSSIDETGLVPKSRLYVHLSSDYDTAVNVGARHGDVAVYTVDAARMHADGFRFYLSVNGVWLTERVPREYLRKDVRCGTEAFALFRERCTVRQYRFSSLPDEVSERCADGMAVLYGEKEMRLYGREAFEELLSRMSNFNEGNRMIRYMLAKAHPVSSPEMLACVIGMFCRERGIAFDARRCTDVIFIGRKGYVEIRVPDGEEDYADKK